MKSPSLKKKVSAFILICVLVSGCARNQKIIDHSNFSLESELGNAIHRQILQTVPVYSEKILNDYVQEVGGKIASFADRKNLVYRFVVLEDDRIYATFAPGGYVYITTGFFRFLQSEIELAGILAFEIASLQYKDPRFSRFKKTLDMMLTTGSYVAPAFGAIGALSVIGLVVIDMAASGEKSQLKRIEEADRKALNYLVKSGYDPQGLANLLYRMGNPKLPERAYLYDYLQSHPLSMGRLNKLNENFKNLQLEDKQFNAGRDLFLMKTEILRSTFARKQP